MARNIVETIIGALVLCVAVVFVVYAFTTTDGAGPSGYEVVAKFDKVDGLKRGADVTVAGIKIGTVVSLKLDKEYTAVVRMKIQDGTVLTADTTARIVSESLLGGMTVLLDPGSSNQFLGAGSQITRTQGSILLADLIARFMFGGVSGVEKK